MHRRFLAAIAAIVGMAVLAGCGSKPATEATEAPGATPAPAAQAGPQAQPQAKMVLKVGATPEPWAPIVKKAKEIAARENLEIQLVEFNDYVKPNLALADGEIDVNLFQHRPYFDKFKESRGLKIAPASEPLYIVPTAVYS